MLAILAFAILLALGGSFAFTLWVVSTANKIDEENGHN